MSDRPGKSRPMPAAPYDDPSIPVLTERLTLPELDLDISLPPEAGAPVPPAPALPDTGPAAGSAAPDLQPAAPPTSPSVLGADFNSDTWLVETIPMAPPPLDLSGLDFPPFELPPLAPVARGSTAPPATEEPWMPPTATPSAPVTASAPPSPEPGFAAPDLVIPASLMRTPSTAGFDSAGSAAPREAELAPTFDRVPVIIAADPLPTLDTPAPAAAAFGVPAAAGSAMADETQLRESILAALSQRLPHEVESILRRHLAPAIDAAIDAAAAQLAAEIRRVAAHTLRELVDHAVAAELAKLREPK